MCMSEVTFSKNSQLLLGVLQAALLLPLKYVAGVCVAALTLRADVSCVFCDLKGFDWFEK